MIIPQEKLEVEMEYHYDIDHLFDKDRPEWAKLDRSKSKQKTVPPRVYSATLLFVVVCDFGCCYVLLWLDEADPTLSVSVQRSDIDLWLKA